MSSRLVEKTLKETDGDAVWCIVCQWRCFVVQIEVKQCLMEAFLWELVLVLRPVELSGRKKTCWEEGIVWATAWWL